ncbi:Fc.00g061410.m01.CDS01 [Cosmosporella sp. VM-42]
MEQNSIPVAVEPSMPTGGAVSNSYDVRISNLSDSSDTGYGKLARFIAAFPETAIFRKFGLLNMINLLRLQAELHDLEQQLEAIRAEDRVSGDPIRRIYGVSFRTLRQYAEDGDSTQYDIMVDIGKKLDTYNKALEQVLCLDKAARPRKSDLEFLRTWLDMDTKGESFLEGIEATVWDEANQHDLVTIRNATGESDKFSEFLNETLLNGYHALIGRFTNSNERGEDDKIRVYNEKKVSRVGDGIVAALSAVLPMIAILALYFVHSMIKRIGLVIVFTTIFSVTLAIFTGAKKAEIFAATATFAAVEVVYIGSTSGAQ